MGSDNYMMYWNLSKYRKNINKKKYIDHLKNIEDIDDLLFILKYSNIFTGKEATQETKNNVRNIIFYKYYSHFSEKIETFLNDIKILNEIYEELIREEERVISQINKQKLPILLINSLNYVIKDTSENANSINSDTRDYWIIFISKLLKKIYRDKITFKYIETSEKTPDDIISVFKDLDIFSSIIIDSWKYSELEIKQIDTGASFKEVGNFGKEQLYSLATFLELKEGREFKGSLLDDICKSEEMFYKQKKEYLSHQIEEYFYTTDFEQKYLGVSLSEWIKSYETLYELSIMSNDDKILLTEESIKKIYETNDISRSSIEIILKYLTFSTSSRDLYDSPLIKFGNEYLILPRLIEAIDFSRSIISLLSNEQNQNDTGISQKGKNFEKYIMDLVNKQFPINGSSLKLEKAGDTFEIDGLFYDQGTIVILEMKTQKQPENYIDYYKNQVDLEKYIEKFNRNADFFIQNPEHIYKKLNINEKINLNFQKIFVTNVSQKRVTYQDVYIIDEIDFFNFMNREAPSINYINNSIKKIICIPLEHELYTGEPSVEQLVKLIKNPFKRKRIEANIKTRKINFRGYQNIEIFVLDDFIKNV